MQTSIASHTGKRFLLPGLRLPVLGFSPPLWKSPVGVDSPKMKVSCRLGAYWLYLGYSTTERVLSSVCEPWGSLSLLCFLLPHPCGCRTADNIRTTHSRHSTVCQSTKPFDCVSTLTDAVAPTYICIQRCDPRKKPGNVLSRRAFLCHGTTIHRTPCC